MISARSDWRFSIASEAPPRRGPAISFAFPCPGPPFILPAEPSRVALIAGRFQAFSALSPRLPYQVELISLSRLPTSCSARRMPLLFDGRHGRPCRRRHCCRRLPSDTRSGYLRDSAMRSRRCRIRARDASDARHNMIAAGRRASRWRGDVYLRRASSSYDTRPAMMTRLSIDELGISA